MPSVSTRNLAHRAKVSDATIKFVETARHRPSRATLIRLLDVAELKLSWAQVPGHHKPPAEKSDPPSPPPQAPLESRGPSPDPSQFLMSLIGFDEIPLPLGTPKTLRVFQQRHRIDEEAGAKAPLDGSQGNR